jgi:hypothetical protein
MQAVFSVRSHLGYWSCTPAAPRLEWTMLRAIMRWRCLTEVGLTQQPWTEAASERRSQRSPRSHPLSAMDRSYVYQPHWLGRRSKFSDVNQQIAVTKVPDNAIEEFRVFNF